MDAITSSSCCREKAENSKTDESLFLRYRSLFVGKRGSTWLERFVCWRRSHRQDCRRKLVSVRQPPSRKWWKTAWTLAPRRHGRDRDGHQLFPVTDNGSAFSKAKSGWPLSSCHRQISSSQDLAAIQTLGSAGEALAPSLRLEGDLPRPVPDESSGIKVVNNGGASESSEEAACPEGTSFCGARPFFNNPGRLKFLKKASPKPLCF